MRLVGTRAAPAPRSLRSALAISPAHAAQPRTQAPCAQTPRAQTPCRAHTPIPVGPSPSPRPAVHALPVPLRGRWSPARAWAPLQECDCNPAPAHPTATPGNCSGEITDSLKAASQAGEIRFIKHRPDVQPVRQR